MRVRLTEMLWLEQHAVTFTELAELSGLGTELLSELVSAGAIEPLEPAAAEPRYGAAALEAARRARRLRDDFELDANALSLMLGLLERVGELEHELRAVKARMPGRRP